MNVTQLLHKLRIISNIEIVVSLLPEMLRIPNQSPRHSLLQRLQCIGQSNRVRFANRWPIQAILWLEWGSSTAESILLRFAKKHRWPIQAILWLEWGSSTAESILLRFAKKHRWPIQAILWLEWDSSTAEWSLLWFTKQHRWPIQAICWLEWGSSTAESILLWFAKQHRWPIQTICWLEWDSPTAGRLRLAEQEMNMLRHDHMPINLKPETAPHPLQS